MTVAEPSKECSGMPDGGVPVVITGADLPGGSGPGPCAAWSGCADLRAGSGCAIAVCRSSAWSDVGLVVQDSEQGWIEALLQLSARHPRQVLFAAQTPSPTSSSRNRAVLEEHYLFVLPAHRTVQMLADKSAFAVWAEANAFPTPRTRVVSSAAELDAAWAAPEVPGRAQAVHAQQAVGGRQR